MTQHYAYPGHPSAPVAQRPPVNVAGIVSLVFVAGNVLMSFFAPMIFVSVTVSSIGIASAILTAVNFGAALGAITFGLIGVLSSKRIRWRWTAIGGLVAGSATMLSALANTLGGYLAGVL